MKFKPMPALFSGQKMWGAIGRKGHTFVILEDFGKFTASYKFTKKHKTIYIIEHDNAVTSFEEAKIACEAADNPQ